MRVHDGPPEFYLPIWIPAILLVLLLLGIVFTIMQIPDQTPEEEDHALMEKAAINLERCTGEIMEWREIAKEYRGLKGGRQCQNVKDAAK